MSAFAGWLGPAPDGGAEAILADMLRADAPQRPFDSRHGHDWALAVSHGARPRRLEVAGDAVVVTVGAPLWPAGVPTIDGSAVPDLFDGAAEALARTDGAFGLLALDPVGKRLRAAVDRFSTCPVFYARIRSGIVLGSSPRVVARHPDVDDTLSAQAIADYLYATVVPAPATIYESVRCLLPGEILEFGRGALNERRYWTPRFAPEGTRGADVEPKARVRALLRASVESSAGTGAAVGCFLSGGIDSSSVVGMLREVTGERPRTFSIGFEAEGYDEMGYARLVARHFDAEHHEYYVTPADVVEAIPDIARACGQPFGNASAIPAFHCAALARRQGVDRMLAGDGGDELFGGNERYAAQWVFGQFASLPAAAQGALRAWAQADPPPLGRLPVARKAVSYVRHASIPLPDRLDVFNYLNRLGAAALLDPGFAAQVNPARALEDRRRIYQSADAATDVDRMLALDYKITLADNDLPKVTVMCEQAGVDVRFPFLAPDLVDFAGALPAGEKVRRARLRWFFKQAMKGFLPDAVLAKSKHGFGLPFGIWVTRDAALRERVHELLGGAGRRGILSQNLLRDVRSRLLAEQPRYYGPLVWTIIMLESWLDANT